MNFQGLSQINDYQYYLDIAFNAAKKEADFERQNTKATDRINKSKDIELQRVKTVRARLEKHLMLILKSFPSLDAMSDFYQELVRATLDYDEIKKSLGAVAWANDKIVDFGKKTELKIKRTREVRTVNEHRRAFYGRVSSLMRQIGDNLKILENARKVMKTYPSIKQKRYTVALAGFPNVGKSTLLAKMTGSKPQIKNYAFTTKSLNVASFGDTIKVQCIDTPGTLNRPNKMNSIERLADIAMKYEADLIVFIFDATADTKQEIKLYEKIKELDKPMLVYVSKSDLQEIPKELEKYDYIIDPEELKKELIKNAKT